MVALPPPSWPITDEEITQPWYAYVKYVDEALRDLAVIPATSFAGFPGPTLVDEGKRGICTDATTNAFLAKVVGGSTYRVPVIVINSTWVIG